MLQTEVLTLSFEAGRHMFIRSQIIITF